MTPATCLLAGLDNWKLASVVWLALSLEDLLGAGIVVWWHQLSSLGRTVSRGTNRKNDSSPKPLFYVRTFLVYLLTRHTHNMVHG
jgi:hypothetical protein